MKQKQIQQKIQTQKNFLADLTSNLKKHSTQQDKIKREKKLKSGKKKSSVPTKMLKKQSSIQIEDPQKKIKFLNIYKASLQPEQINQSATHFGEEEIQNTFKALLVDQQKTISAKKISLNQLEGTQLSKIKPIIF